MTKKEINKKLVIEVYYHKRETSSSYFSHFEPDWGKWPMAAKRYLLEDLMRSMTKDEEG